jgi:hypothetical protein
MFRIGYLGKIRKANGRQTLTARLLQPRVVGKQPIKSCSLIYATASDSALIVLLWERGGGEARTRREKVKAQTG